MDGGTTAKETAGTSATFEWAPATGKVDWSMTLQRGLCDWWDLQCPQHAMLPMFFMGQAEAWAIEAPWQRPQGVRATNNPMASTIRFTMENNCFMP
jgi:hypothetical protein